MGASVSVVQINSDVLASVVVMNKTAQECYQQDNSAMSIYVNQKHCRNQNIDISQVNMGSSGSFNIKCAQSNNTSNQIQQDVMNKLVNTMAAIVSSLGIGATGATTITNSTVNIAMTITNTYLQTCAQNVTTTKGIYINQDSGDNCDKQNVTISYITLTDLQGGLANCVQQNQAVNDAKQSLINTIQNEAMAKVKGVMGLILMIVLIIVLAIGAGTYGSKKLLMSPVFMGSIFAMVLIYGGITWLKKWFPFNKKDDDKYGPPMNIILAYPKPNKVVPVKK
jgi:hypothetical protein